MDNYRDQVAYFDDFFGHGELPTTQSDSDWLISDLSLSGAPTYTKGGINGEATLAMSSTAGLENVALYQGDDLNFDIDSIKRVAMRVKMGQSAIGANSEVAFGLCSAHNDTVDSLTEAAVFRVIGSVDTTAVVVETDDGSNNNDDVATGQVLIDSYKEFVIDFSGGKSDVKFYMDNGDGSLRRVAASTTFNMSGYSGGLQPFVQIQKASGTDASSIIVDYVRIESNR